MLPLLGDKVILVDNAIKNENVLKIDYVSVKGEHTVREILPKEWIGNLLVGWDLEKEAYRRFYVENIKTLEIVK